jgi:hypothetical protein
VQQNFYLFRKSPDGGNDTDSMIMMQIINDGQFVLFSSYSVMFQLHINWIYMSETRINKIVRNVADCRYYGDKVYMGC